MTQQYDAIVLGLGAMGSAACYHLARSRRYPIDFLSLSRFGGASRESASVGA